MYHFFIPPEQLGEPEIGGFIEITGSDVNHIVNVLRMRPGEQLTVHGGERYEYLCAVESFTEQAVRCRVLSAEESSKELPVRITLYQGLPKSDKLEFIIQKAVELGVYRVVPVVTERTVVKLDRKKAESRQKRWQAIAESAAKQCGRNLIPEVTLPMSYKEALRDAQTQSTNQPATQPTNQPATQPTNQPTVQPTGQPTAQSTAQPTGQPTGQPTAQPTVQSTNQPATQPTNHPTAQSTAQLTNQPATQPTAQPTAQPTDPGLLLMPYECAEGVGPFREMVSSLRPGMCAAVLIGPEGGFAMEETVLAEAAGFRTVSLGKRILRTETAGLAVLSYLMLNLES